MIGSQVLSQYKQPQHAHTFPPASQQFSKPKFRHQTTMSDTSDAEHRVQKRLYSRRSLAQRLNLVARLGHDALLSQKLPRPVVLLLGPVFTHNGVACVLTIPEHTAIEILGVRLELPAVEITARVVAKVVVERGLDGPFADKDGVRGVGVGLGEVAGSVGGVVGVRAADEKVDVCVDDDVRVDVGPVWVPGLWADEAVGDGDGQGLGFGADGFEGGDVVFVQVGDRVLSLAEVV